MSFQPASRAIAETEHPPARSGTPTAWTTLVLVALLVAGWFFVGPITCWGIRSFVRVIAWSHGQTVTIGPMEFGPDGSLRLQAVSWTRGRGTHASSVRCETMEIVPGTVWECLFPKEAGDRLWIRELRLGRTNLLIDMRADQESASDTGPATRVARSWGVMPRLIPASLVAGPIDAVVIGDSGRVAVEGLRFDLPSRWRGKVSFHEAEAGLWSGHRTVTGAAATAYWEPGKLTISSLPLGEGLSLEELTLKMQPQGLDFGVRGSIGRGLLRGDGTIGVERPLETTFVGENLAIDALAGLIPATEGATGTVDQARVTFRGDPQHPSDADASLRLVGRNFRWEGKGWESLRLAASMTGRNLTVSECSLRQGDNEVRATGRSSLPAHWRALLQAPFTTEFQADLSDAETLAALLGPGFPIRSGSLYLDGAVRGADNQAEGYCNFSGIGTKVRRLSMDWMSGCLFFEGATTRIAYAEARAGNDAVRIRGTVANSRLHAYDGEAELRVHDVAARLGELGMAVPQDIGAGEVSATWRGNGDITANRGSFQAKVSNWVSRRSRAGISGTFEGSYAPGMFALGRAEIMQDDLSFKLGLTADGVGLTLKDMYVTRKGSPKPLAAGEVTLPLDLTGSWSAEKPWRTLAMDRPMAVTMTFDGMDVGQLADLLGQPSGSSGRLTGRLAAAGTPAAPDLNADLRIAGFSVSGAQAGDVTIAATRLPSKATRLLLDQARPQGHPLHLEAELPLKMTKSADRIGPDADVKLAGTVAFQKASLDPWARQLGYNVLSNAVVDGTVTMSGTVTEPQLAGALSLKAAGFTAPGPISLTGVDLPLTFAGGMVTTTRGSAAYNGRSIALTGNADWTSRWKAELKISGAALPVELMPGVTAKGRADLVWTTDGTTRLGGTIALDPLSVDLRAELTPSFVPPGFRVDPADPRPHFSSPTTLDLALRTRPASRDDHPAVVTDLRIAGTLDAPLASGTVTLLNQTLRLPSGIYALPDATVSYDSGKARISGAAWGVTRTGLGILTLGGAPENPEAFPISPSIPAATAVYSALMTSSSPSPVAEAPFWLRQEALFSTPAQAWAYPTGESAPAGLGFYGAPWIWNLRIRQPVVANAK